MADPRVSLDPSGVDLRMHPGAQKRSQHSVVGVPALGLDTSRISQVNIFQCTKWLILEYIFELANMIIINLGEWCQYTFPWYYRQQGL